MISTAITPRIGRAMAIATSRHNSAEAQRKREEARQLKLEVLRKAIKTVKGTHQWLNGERKVIFVGSLEGKKASIVLVNGQEGIDLFLHVGRFESEPFRIGYFNPETGLQISKNASEIRYLDWNSHVRKAMS